MEHFKVWKRTNTGYFCLILVNNLDISMNWIYTITATGIQRFDMFLNYIMILGEPLRTDRLRSIPAGTVIDKDNSQNS